MVELKPCPFCGVSGERYLRLRAASISPITKSAEVVCDHCHSAGPTGYSWDGSIDSAMELAANLWNDRHEEQPTSEA